MSPIEHRYESRIPTIDVQKGIDVFSTCEKYGEQQPLDDEFADSPDQRQPMELGNNDEETIEDILPDAEDEVQPIVFPAAVEPTIGLSTPSLSTTRKEEGDCKHVGRSRPR